MHYRTRRNIKENLPWDRYTDKEKEYWKDTKLPRLGIYREDQTITPRREKPSYGGPMPVITPDSKINYSMGKNLFEQLKDTKQFRNDKDIRDFIYALDRYGKRAASGGGIASLKKSININGQPHNLAWIRPDEASALKAMGGSGKKVDGIPAYFDEWSMGGSEAELQMSDVHHGVEGAAAPGKPMEYDYESPEYTKLRSKKEQAKLPEAFTYETGVEKEDQDDFWNRPSDDSKEYQKVYDRSELNSLKTKLIERLGVPGMEKYMRGLGTAGLREVIGKFHTGWEFGGELGTAEGISRNIASDYASKLGLKKYMKRLKDLEGEELSDKDREERLEELNSDFRDQVKATGGVYKERKDLTGMMSDYKKDPRVEDSIWRQALGWLAPGGTITDLGAKGLNALASIAGVMGEYTTEDGKTFRVMDDGTLVEPDMPPDPSSVDPGTVEVAETVEAVAPSPEVVVAEAGPMKAYQTGLQSIESNEGINNSIQILMDQYGISEGEARVMLGLDVNIA